MLTLVKAINEITTQVWAFMILCCGILAAVWFHKSGLDVGIAAGIIGAGINMFQSQAKANTSTTTTSVTPAPSVTNNPSGLL